jgi:hypothetical protein
VLHHLTDWQLWQLCHSMDERAVGAGHALFRQGDPADTFYLVKEGSFCRYNAGEDKLVPRRACAVVMVDTQRHPISSENYLFFRCTADHRQAFIRLQTYCTI